MKVKTHLKGGRRGGDHDILYDPDDDLMPPVKPVGQRSARGHAPSETTCPATKATEAAESWASRSP